MSVIGDLHWAGTGAITDYTVDMGYYYDMVRGIQTSIEMTNENDSNQNVYTCGAGLKQEW